MIFRIPKPSSKEWIALINLSRVEQAKGTSGRRKSSNKNKKGTDKAMRKKFPNWKV